MSIIGNPLVCGGGSNGGDVYAFIVCAYPSGYSCTASNGVNTLSAPDTSGLVVFSIPTPSTLPESWTITATDGVKTYSKTVSISSEGQSISVTLANYLYYEGDQITDVTGGWSYVPFVSGWTAGTLNTAYNGTICYLSAPGGGQRQISAVTANKIDITDFSSIHFRVTNYSFGGTGYHRAALVSSRGGITSAVKQNSFTETGEMIMDVSQITGEYYLGVFVTANSTTNCIIGFDQCWLE